MQYAVLIRALSSASSTWSLTMFAAKLFIIVPGADVTKLARIFEVTIPVFVFLLETTLMSEIATKSRLRCTGSEVVAEGADTRILLLTDHDHGGCQDCFFWC